MRSTFTASAVVAAALATAAAPAARANTVSDWNGYASTAIVATAGQPPPVAVLSFAMVQGAVYDAVDAVDGSRRAYLLQPPGAPTNSQDAAAATAAHDVLVALFPAQQTTLDDLYRNSLAGISDMPEGSKAGGIADGEAASATMIAARAHDGRGGPFTPVYGTTPGVYRPTTP